MKPLFISLLFFTTLSQCKIKFHDDETLPKNAQDFLNMYSELEVETSSSQINFDDYQTMYYKMVEVGRNKRKTYDYFMKKSKKIVERLSSNLFIATPKTAIQSPVQMVFINKKKHWEFSKFFAVRINENQISKFETVLEPFKLQAIRFEPDLENKRLKQKIAQAFSVAKIETNNFLTQNFENAIKIQSVKEIQVEGYKQFSSSGSSGSQQQKQKPEEKSIDNSRYAQKIDKQGKNYNERQIKSVNLKVIFKLIKLNDSSQKTEQQQQSKLSQQQLQLQKEGQTQEAEEQQL